MNNFEIPETILMSSAITWNCFEGVPKPVSSNIVHIDSNNFIFATAAFLGDNDDERREHGIYNYNTSTNKWSLLFKYPSTANHVIPTTYHSICYDNDNKRIFIQGYERKLIIYDCNNNRFDVNQIDRQIGSYSQLIAVKGLMHLIGGATNKYHLIWDNDKKQLQQIYEFNEWESGNYGAVLVDIKTKKEILLLGGYDYSVYKKLDTMWRLNSVSLKWDKLQITLPHKINMFGCVLSSDDRFIVIFGGETDGNDDLDEIWILDLITMKWRKSKIKCPKQGCFQAVLGFNQQNASLSVYGWIRMQQNMPSLPMDVIELISKWYCTDSVHLFQWNEQFHWKININDILK